MTIAFFGALSGLALLFLVRYIEERRNVRVGAGARYALDRFALVLKSWCEYVGRVFEHIPKLAGMLARASVAYVVRRIAHVAERLSRTAHAAADMVSYKHRFERREPRSAFLKQMSAKDGPVTPSNDS